MQRAYAFADDSTGGGGKRFFGWFRRNDDDGVDSQAESNPDYIAIDPDDPGLHQLVNEEFRRNPVGAGERAIARRQQEILQERQAELNYSTSFESPVQGTYELGEKSYNVLIDFAKSPYETPAQYKDRISGLQEELEAKYELELINSERLEIQIHAQRNKKSKTAQRLQDQYDFIQEEILAVRKSISEIDTNQKGDLVILPYGSIAKRGRNKKVSDNDLERDRRTRANIDEIIEPEYLPSGRLRDTPERAAGLKKDLTDKDKYGFSEEAADVIMKAKLGRSLDDKEQVYNDYLQKKYKTDIKKLHDEYE